MAAIKKVALIGGGVIGGGWTGRIIQNGIDVVIVDPDPQAERKVNEVVENANRAYGKLTLAPIHKRGAFTVTSDMQAIADADFVQENVPDREDLKIKVLADASRIVGPDVIIASSSSGLLPSDIQVDCVNPDRVVIGHPFNPVYLLPLCETMGGKQTSADALDRADAFYRSIGMHVLRVRNEIEGYISDRLQEALWRESLHLVNDGIATTDEIDQAIAYGPGLRWAFMGVNLTFTLAGGEQGMRHMLEHFGPALELPWTKLKAPELTDQLIDRMVDQTEAQRDGTDIRDLERLRDDCLVSVMQALRGQNYASGVTLQGYEESLYELSHDDAADAATDPSQPLQLHRAKVELDWVDYNGHMTEGRYLQVFGDCSDAFFRYLGVDAAYHEAGNSYYTVETHISHLHEVAGGEPLYATTQLLDADEKRLHLFHRLYRERGDVLLATGEHMLLHVDTKQAKACPAQPHILEKVRATAAAHADLPKPDQAGRSIGITRK